MTKRWPLAVSFLAFALVCVLVVTASPATEQRTLFLLAGTSFLNDTSATFPATLYTVSARHTLRLFRTVVSGSEGTTNILDDMQGKIYVTFPSDLGCCGRAPTKVSVIHEQRPGEDDVVTFNPKATPITPYATATAAAPGLGSYALFVLFPQPPPTVNSHATFMQFLRSTATTLVAVAGAQPAKGSRVTRNDWGLYSYLTFSGSPGGPGYYPPPEVSAQNGELTMRYGGKSTVVDQAPRSLAPAAGDDERIVAANRRFVVTWLYRTRDRFAPAMNHVHDRQLGRWSEVKFSSSSPESRIFGPWLATIATSYAGGTTWRDRNPGHADERNRWVKDVLPNVSQEFDAVRMFSIIPGRLILDNLADGRRITVDTHEEDSEILDVRSDGLVLYRVNDEIFSAQIQGDKLSAPTLVVKGEDVPEVHWAFWSNASATPATSGKPPAKR